MNNKTTKAKEHGATAMPELPEWKKQVVTVGFSFKETAWRQQSTSVLVAGTSPEACDVPGLLTRCHET